MADYRIEHLGADFKMTVYGVAFDDFNDFAGNAQKSAARKAEIEENGSLTALLSQADGQLYTVN
jgi:hypothetical protein